MEDAKERIGAAFRDLASSHPCESVGIQAICAKADLSRKTFSRYFQGKQDVAAYIMHEDFIGPVISLRELLPQDMLMTSQFIERNLTVFRNERAFYSSVIGEFGRGWFVREMARLTLDMGGDPYVALGIQGDELDFAQHYFAHATASMFLWWFDRGMDVPEPKVAEWMVTWIYAHSRELLHKDSI